MNTERLLKLADYLETVPPERFDMGIWASDLTCGTAGCAIGHACQIPEFNAAGLHLERNARGALRPVFGDNPDDFAACAAFFEIDRETAEELFDPAFYSDPNEISTGEVIDCIRAVVAAK